MQNKQLAHSFVCTFMLSPRLRFSVVRRAKREHVRDWWRETGEERD